MTSLLRSGFRFSASLYMSLLLLLALFCFSAGTQAQTAASYTNATTATGSLSVDLNGNAVNMTTGTTSLANSGDDNRSTVTNLGFTFWFAGTNYTQFSTNTNGFCQLGSSRISATQVSLAGTNPLITPFGEDISVNSGGFNRGKLVGTAPYRCYVIEWNNVGVNYNSTANNARFQLRLYETTNRIEFVYGNMAVGSAFSSPLLTIPGARIGFSASATDIRTVVTPSTFQSPASITAANVNNYATGTISDLNSSSNGSRRTYVFAPTPVLSVTPSILAFGYTAVGSTSANQTYSLSGTHLSAFPGNITVTAPAGFEVSLSSGSGFAGSINVPYTSPTLSSTTIYVRFKPTGTPQAYSDNITNSGAGAGSVTVAVTGTSLPTCSGTPAPGNTLSTSNSLCSGDAVTLSLQNAIDSYGLTYRWQSSPDNSTWSNITSPLITANFTSLPANTNVYENASVTGGVLRLTPASGGQTGGYVIQTAPGSNFTAVRISFDYRIFDGTGADGFSLSYASGIANNSGNGEAGEGSGLIVTFDTYDNAAGTTNSQIRIYYGGSLVWNNAIGAFNLRNSSYRTAVITIDNYGKFYLTIGGTLIAGGIDLPGYISADKTGWKFKFSGRTGGSTDMHSIDNLDIIFGNESTYTTTPVSTNYYRCIVTCAASSTSTTATAVPVYFEPSYTWRGTTSGDWNTLSNWSFTDFLEAPTNLPSPCDNIIVPSSGITNFPNVPADITCKNLTINPSATVKILPSQSLTVNGTIINNAGASGLLINSDATGTGSLIHNTPNVPGTVERYVTGSTNKSAMMYHMVSVPLEPSENSVSELFYGSYLSYFDEADNDWVGLGSPLNTPLDETRGYLIYYILGTNSTFSFPGKLNSGDFTPALTRSNQGWNLIPNPFPSAIGWNTGSWTKTNIDGTIYFWPSGASSSSSNYCSWNGVVGTGSITPTQFIPVGQAFFVHANNSGASLVIPASAKAHNTQAFYKSSAEEIPELLRIKCVADNTMDELIVNFRADATEDFDASCDAYKLTGGADAPQISTKTADDVSVSINSLPLLQEKKVIPLNLSYSKDTTLLWVVLGTESFEEDLMIYLEDKKLKKVTDLKLQAKYPFQYSKGDEQRFNLIFGDMYQNPTDSTSFTAYQRDNKITIIYPAMAGKEAVVRVYDMTGKLLHNEEMLFEDTVQVNCPSTAGVYIVQVVSGKNTASRKIVIL